MFVWHFYIAKVLANTVRLSICLNRRDSIESKRIGISETESIKIAIAETFVEQNIKCL